MSLKQKLQTYFELGAAVSAKNLEDTGAASLLKEEFSLITAENEMKPMFILDHAQSLENLKTDGAPGCDFTMARKYLDYAKKHKLKLRAHTLVWHNQTPRWFFAKDYSDLEDAPLVDRETMLFRMEAFIRDYMTFVYKEYPGLVYAWDVCNEAVADDASVRKSLWTQTLGEDYCFKAFEFAKRYNSEDTLLFYNDYSSFVPKKRDFILDNILKPLMEHNLVDGMGMQTHLLMDSDLGLYEEALKIYGETGLILHVTELDIHTPGDDPAHQQALLEKYSELFGIYKRAVEEKTAKLEAVIFWGIRDEDSWLTEFRKEASFPLLFAGDYKRKAIYDQLEGEL